MSLHHVNLITISVVFSLVLTALQGAKSPSTTEGQGDASNIFSSSHGLQQTHPSQSGFGGIDNPGSRGSTVRARRTSPLDYSERATAELRRNSSLSTPDECARTCHGRDPPRICYYHFTPESRTVRVSACQVCAPNATNAVRSDCPCVLADGVEREILTANKMVPGPSVQVCEGDEVVIDLENQREGMEVTLHQHGIWRRELQHYDGPPFVKQLPIQAGHIFRYQWTAENAGTHTWRAHAVQQQMDGVYGSLIVRQPPCKDPNSNQYGHDLTKHVMLISDWIHEDAAERFPERSAVHTGQDPDTVLINEKGQFRDPNTGIMTNTPLEVFTITSGSRFRFRMINSVVSECPVQVTFQGHTLTLIATDGKPVHPAVVNTIISFSGERYDFVINADQAPDAYWIQVRGLGECGNKHVQQLAVLRYARGPHKPNSQPPTYNSGLPQGVVLNPLDAICHRPRDDAVCINQLKTAKHIDKKILRELPDVRIYLVFRSPTHRPDEVVQPQTSYHILVAPNGDHDFTLTDEIPVASKPLPLLFQVDDIAPEQFCNGDNRPADCGPNCVCTHKIESLPLNALVEVVFIDEAIERELSHSFNSHGYALNVIGIGRSPDINAEQTNLEHTLDLDRRGLLHRNLDSPIEKDTIVVPNNGYVVGRFRAENSGYWLLNSRSSIYHAALLNLNA